MTNKKRIVSLSVLLAISLCAGGATVSAGDKFDTDPKHKLPRPDTKAPDLKKPVKVFILMGQSNMVGMGEIEPETTKGTLAYLTKKEGRYPHLLDEAGKWTVRNDVWYVQVVVGQRQNWLQPGTSNTTIGPELQFGHIMGQIHDEMVLLIKAAQGGRSLGYDFLPPGSERYTINGTVYAGYKDVAPSWPVGTKPEPYSRKGKPMWGGWEYDECVAEIHKVLDNLKTSFPSYSGQGYEIAGFAWFHGFNDIINGVYADRYELNLANFIKAVRSEFKVPNAPFAIATCAFEGWDNSNARRLKVINGQLAVSGETGKHREFAGNVKTVEARDFWREVEVSPKNQGYHYNRNAETYMEVGNALGWGMAEMLKKQDK
jgi:alpha-galactosidase